MGRFNVHQVFIVLYLKMLSDINHVKNNIKSAVFLHIQCHCEGCKFYTFNKYTFNNIDTDSVHWKIRRTKYLKGVTLFYSTMLDFESPLPKSFNVVFESLSHNLSSISIRKGVTKTKVYADSIEPSWIVTSSNNRILVAGDYLNQEALDAVQMIVKKGINIGKSGFVIYYPINAKKIEIGKQIRRIKPYLNWRNYYVLKLNNTNFPIKLPDGYRLEFITPELLHKGYHNTQLVIDEMKSERRDEFDFLDKSFGYCTIYDNEITSWCMSEYNTDQRFEIGIETHQDHRRKGLALQIARACINFGAEKGYTKVGWHCWKTNLPSNKLASSLGFKYVLEYPTEYLEVV